MVQLPIESRKRHAYSFKGPTISFFMPTRKKIDEPHVALHSQISGIVAEWLIEMKDAGYVNNYTDAVNQGVVLLYEKFKTLASVEGKQSS